MDFKEKIRPFFWVEHEASVSACLNVGDYKNEVFQTREEEGFEGNGYDWTSLAQVFLAEQMPELVGVVRFDPEADMFCAYSDSKEALEAFTLSFKNACENEAMLQDLFSRAELD